MSATGKNVSGGGNLRGPTAGLCGQYFTNDCAYPKNGEDDSVIPGDLAEARDSQEQKVCADCIGAKLAMQGVRTPVQLASATVVGGNDAVLGL